MFKEIRAGIRITALVISTFATVWAYGELQRAIGKFEGINEGKLIAANEIKSIFIKHGYDLDVVNEEIAGVA